MLMAGKVNMKNTSESESSREGRENKNYWTVLQAAVSSGTLQEIAEIVGDKNFKKEDINFKDEDGETPLYKAVAHRNIGALPPLIAFGADVNIHNKDGKSPLSLAADMKEYDICRLLCDVGARVDLAEWRVAIENIQMLSKKDQSIIEMIKEQGKIDTVRKEGGIVSGVFPITPGNNDFKLFNYQVKLFSSNSKQFFLYWSKLTSGCDEIRYYLEDDQWMVSDEFKIQCWGYEKKSLDVTMRIPLDVKFKENMSTFTSEGMVNIQKSPQKSDNENTELLQLTEVDLNIEFSKNGIVQFALIETKSPEVFKTSKEGAKIYPKAEPSSVIEYLTGTFQSGGQLCISFAEDHQFDTSKQDLQFLFTKVIRIMVSGGYKPRKPVAVTLPVHSTEGDVFNPEITILHSSLDEPEEKDWEILEGSIQNASNTNVLFHVEQFSWMVGVKSKNLTNAKQQATAAVKNEIQVEIFTMLKHTDQGFNLVVEMTKKAKGKERRKRWKDERHYLEQSTRDFGVKENRTYKIEFSDSLNIDRYRQEDIIFRFTRRDDQIFKTFTLDGKEKPSGVISFNERLFDISRKKKDGWLDIFRFRKDKHVTKKEIEGEFMKRFEMPIGNHTQEFGVNNDESKEATKQLCCAPRHRRNSEDESGEAAKSVPRHQRDSQETPSKPRERRQIKFKKVDVKVDPSDPNCTVPVLRKKSLYRLAGLLTHRECNQLGLKLLTDRIELGRLSKGDNFPEKMFEQWRNEHQRPNKSLASKLADVLEDMDKLAEAEVIRTAFSKETEFNYECN